MGDLFWNKVAAAVIGLVLMVMVIGVVGDIVFPDEQGGEDHASLAYPIDLEAVMGGTGGSGPVVEEVVDLGALLAVADASSGERTFRRCVSCHNAAPDAGNLQGPNLWNVVGREAGTYPGFSYTAEMSAHGPWTYEALDSFIENPRADVPGTAMAFAGIRNDEDRADLLAYLQTLSDNPVPFPAPAPAETEEDMAAGGDMMDTAEGEMAETADDIEDQIQALEDAGETVIDDQAGDGEMPEEAPEDGGN
ncbi:cytochrome c family protein [Hyphobacterium sp. CCMP332]|uniref:c-type cytochrome n=1 Tax=Hyphobacterium sp. CCMP332 TaxID=2749086 RepID=UPI00164F2B57|nr:cytochrome c family protein [Hyphobacterium sp. CCMP332]QNL19447.1 cytochrome c family protein [Hyphobacterium sp. CCMP332]